MNNILFRTTFLKGEAGNNIESIEKTATVGAVDTYTITLTDGSTTTFEVTNGSDIESIEKTATQGLVDTYTITLTDGSTTTFEVTNGSNVTVDNHLDATSTNPVENRVVTGAINTLNSDVSKLNNNLTVIEYTASSSATTISSALDEFINQANISAKKSAKVKLNTSVGNFDVNITRNGSYYTGTLLRLSSFVFNERYTFLKYGGASTEIVPFSQEQPYEKLILNMWRGGSNFAFTSQYFNNLKTSYVTTDSQGNSTSMGSSTYISNVLANSSYISNYKDVVIDSNHNLKLTFKAKCRVKVEKYGTVLDTSLTTSTYNLIGTWYDKVANGTIEVPCKVDDNGVVVVSIY